MKSTNSCDIEIINTENKHNWAEVNPVDGV